MFDESTGPEPWDETLHIDRSELLKRGAGFVAAASLLSVPSTAFAAPSLRRGGTLRVAYSDGSTKDSLDPSLSFNILGASVNSALHETLVAVDQFWNTRPLLARRFRSNAKLNVWTFELRDAEFHNGRPLTAQDVVYSIARQLNAKNNSVIYGVLSAVLAPGGIKALDRKTVRFTLKRPDAFFPILLAARHAAIVPAGTTTFRGIGTGAFRLKSFTPGRSFELERNRGYWRRGFPYLDGVRGVVISEQSTKVQAVLSGSADLCDAIDYSIVPTVQRNGNSKILRARNSVVYHIAFQTGVPPFNDKRVRTALQLVVDRNEMLRVALKGFGAVTYDVPVLPGDPTFPPALRSRRRDVARARELLRAAGHTNGIDVELFTSQAYAGMVDLAVVFAQQAADAGIRVNVQQAPPQTYWTDYWTVKPAFVSYWIPRHPYSVLNLGYTKDSSSNETKFQDPTLDRLIAQIARTGNRARQRALFQQAMRIVADDSGVLIPLFGDSLWGARKNVNGMRFDLIRLADFTEAWLA